jgi:hypothetical protein
MSIDIDVLYEFEAGRTPVAYYARGHFDDAAFIAALTEHCSAEQQRFPDRLEVVREHWRKVPAGEDYGMYVLPSRPGRGAYAVTAVYL